jgi:hypothetical protein
VANESLISGTRLPDDGPASVNLVGRGRQSKAANTEKSDDQLGLKWVWDIRPGQSPQTSEPPTFRLPEVFNLSTLPPCVHEFVRTVANIPGVQCIVAEEAEHRTVHLSTFADPLTEETERLIYQAEMDLIFSNPNLRFDFHTRRASEAKGELNLSARQHYFGYFGVWGSLDAKSR